MVCYPEEKKSWICFITLPDSHLPQADLLFVIENQRGYHMRHYEASSQSGYSIFGESLGHTDNSQTEEKELEVCAEEPWNRHTL